MVNGILIFILLFILIVGFSVEGPRLLHLLIEKIKKKRNKDES